MEMVTVTHMLVVIKTQQLMAQVVNHLSLMDKIVLLGLALLPVLLLKHLELLLPPVVLEQVRLLILILDMPQVQVLVHQQMEQLELLQQVNLM